MKIKGKIHHMVGSSRKNLTIDNKPFLPLVVTFHTYIGGRWGVNMVSSREKYIYHSF